MHIVEICTQQDFLSGNLIVLWLSSLKSPPGIFCSVYQVKPMVLVVVVVTAVVIMVPFPVLALAFKLGWFAPSFHPWCQWSGSGCTCAWVVCLLLHCIVGFVVLNLHKQSLFLELYILLMRRNTSLSEQVYIIEKMLILWLLCWHKVGLAQRILREGNISTVAVRVANGDLVMEPGEGGAWGGSWYQTMGCAFPPHSFALP